MLSMTLIKKCIDDAVNIFSEKFTAFDIPVIKVCPASRRKVVRDKILEECGVYKEDSYGTEAEVISGPLDTQIVVYQSMIKYEHQVYHAVWHELGHIMFGSEKKFGVDLECDTPLRSGYAVVNEFMAEFIAYSVNERKPFPTAQRANIYLQMAFQEGIVFPYWLSRYYAIILGDETISVSDVDEGKNYVSPEVWKYIMLIMNLLLEQVSTEGFWKVDNNYLEKAGCFYDELFHIVYCRGIMY